LNITVSEFNGYVAAISALINAGVMAFHEIEGFVKFFKPGINEDDLNAIIATLKDDSKRREALAAADAQRAQADIDAQSSTDKS
jgi:hypothetical protein